MHTHPASLGLGLAGFFYPVTTDIAGEVTLEGCCAAQEILQHLWHLLSLDSNILQWWQPKLSPDIAKCPLEAKLPWDTHANTLCWELYQR